uniref:Uncharacterized protein n=1 Tax=Steinernema glaseri TaxID=37863 RepID=A0A1I8A3W0_9BILA
MHRGRMDNLMIRLAQRSAVERAHETLGLRNEWSRREPGPYHFPIDSPINPFILRPVCVSEIPDHKEDIHSNKKDDDCGEGKGLYRQHLRHGKPLSLEEFEQFVAAEGRGVVDKKG